MFAPSSPAPGDGGRRSLVLLGLGAAIGLALAATSILRPEPTRILPADDETIASVNGQDISRSEYLRAVDALGRDRREPISPDDRRRVLSRLVDEELLLQRGIELGLLRRDAKIRNDLVSTVIDTAIGGASSAEPTADEVAGFYRENTYFFAAPGRLRAREVFVRVAPGADEAGSRKRAEDAAARLRQGQDFAAVAADLGDQSVGSLPDAMLPPAKVVEYLGPTAARSALSLSPGQVTDPTRSPDGFHVIQILERDAGDVPPLGEVEPLVRSELRRRRGEQALRSYLDGLRAAARLEMPEQLP
ncbi:MAG: hypothetical protein RL698_770 [Pseudomonadota bacterium]